MASPAQIAANRANSLQSSGPRTEAGKDASRRNALKHGLTGGGVVIPGEDEQEVALRVAVLEAQLVPEGDALASLLVRQVAIATIRSERAYRHETALAAERMRQAADVYDDGRQMLAAQILADISLDPATARRRLLTAPEGIDVLVGRLQILQEKAKPQSFIIWDDAEGTELDHYMGHKPGPAPSRVGMLTRGIVYDHWVGLDPADFADLTVEARLLWAVAEIHATIAAEIAHLEAHRATLDPARHEQGRAEAAERSLLDIKAEGLAVRRYAGAAERSLLKLLKELRVMRYEAKFQAATPAEAAELMTTMVTEMPPLKEVQDELASFCPPPRPTSRPGPRSALGSILTDLKSSYLPISAGRAPSQPDPPSA